MASKRIAATFQRLGREGRKALIPYIAAGDPDPAVTVALLHAMVDAGADILELGIPFSDPMADGPVIQRASERALARGTGLRDVLAMVRAFRDKDRSTPLVLMGYANPIEAMGVEAFVAAARDAGVDGVIVVDYPPEECGAFADALREAGMDMIFLLAPTSTAARIAAIAALASGYVYYVSLRGVTGAGNLDTDEVLSRVREIRAATGLPVGVGFGIRDGVTARRLCEQADAAIIGSRIIEEIEASPAHAVTRVSEFLRGVRSAMDQSA